MKTKFFLKQKGGNKIKDYPQTRKCIIDITSEKFGCSIEDMQKTQIDRLTIIHNKDIDEILQEKFIKKIKSGTYVFEEIQRDKQKLLLLINYGAPISIKSKKGYEKHIMPESLVTIYVQAKNL